MNIKKLAAVTVVASVALIGAIATAAPANAEPVGGSYVVVGSDTLQDSMNALTNGSRVTGSSVRVLANGQAVANFDAFPAGNITAKSLGSPFLRPSGSGAGRDALRASAAGRAWQPVANGPSYNVTGQVDIARSSSGPGSANVRTDGVLAYVPYARDAVSYAYRGDSAALGSLTTAQLKQIYEASGPVDIGGGVTVTGVLPQSTSGTRSFFLSAIGVTTVGGGVSQPANLPENDATALTADNQIIPFSAASWIAQSNSVAPNTIGSTGVKLGAPNGVSPTQAGANSTLAANPTFYGAAPYGRDTYLIVEYARIDSASASYDANLFNLVNPDTTASLTGWPAANASVFNSQPAAVKLRYGFLRPSSTSVIRAFATL